MNFFKRKQNAKILTIEDEIELNNNRLESAIYYEDKIDALNNIKELCETNTFLVGVKSMDLIISSMEEMEEFDVQIDIVLKVFTSENGKEFIEIFLKHENNLKVLVEKLKFNERIYDIIEIVFTLDPKGATGFFSRNRNFISNLLQLIKDGRLFIFSFLINSESLKRSLVFEGIFEELIDNIKNVNDSFNIISSILLDSVCNQNYFYELKWKSLIQYENEFLNLFCVLLDRKNQILKNFKVF